MNFTDNQRGAALMVGSMASFTVNDAFMKSLSDALPLFQALAIRGAGTTMALFVLAAAFGQLTLQMPRRDWGLMALRTLMEMGAAFFFISSLFNMPIANVTAIIQALPLTVTLAGALFLGEAVGWRRMLAILIGFAGILLILRPGSEGFTIFSVYALAAVICVTVRDLAARRMSRATPSVFAAFVAACGVTIFAAIGATFVEWQPVGAKEAMQLGGAMFFIIGGYVFSVAAMRSGDIGFVAPFRYTSLVVALLLGLVFFQEWPDVLTQIGAFIVVATGLFTLLRERHVARRGAAELRLR